MTESEKRADTERVAKALRLPMLTYPDGYEAYEAVNGRQVGTGKYDLKRVKRYLNSAEGQQRIRDRVRKLWCKQDERELCVFYHEKFTSINFDDDNSERGTVYQVVTDTESAAWRAALIWLDERRRAGIEREEDHG